jgi:hypothetical protein
VESRLPGAVLELGTEAAYVVEESPGLVLLGVEPRQAAEAFGVVAVLDHPGDEPDLLAVVGRHELHLADVEAEVVEPLEPLLEAEHVAGGELVDRGELGPQLRVALLDGEPDVPRIDVGGEAAPHLQVEQTAGHVLGGDLEVELALPVGELRVPLAGLDVDDVRRQLAGVAPEQRVRQRAVAPVEAGQMETYQEPDQGVEQAFAQVGDGQAAPGQERTVGERVVEVPRDEHAVVAVGFPGEHRDHLGGGQAVLGQLAQQAVLAKGELVGELLDHVRGGAELDEADDVAVQAEDAVHRRQVPVLERRAERQRRHLRVLRGIGQLQTHEHSVPERRMSPWRGRAERKRVNTSSRSTWCATMRNRGTRS